MSYNLLINEELVDLVKDKETLDQFKYKGRSGEESEYRFDNRGGKNNPGCTIVNYKADNGNIFPLIIMGMSNSMDKPENFMDLKDDEKINEPELNNNDDKPIKFKDIKDYFPSEENDKKNGRWVSEAKTMNDKFIKRATEIQKGSRYVFALLYNENDTRIWLRSAYTTLTSMFKNGKYGEKYNLQSELRNNLDGKFLRIIETFDKNNNDHILTLLLSVTGTNDIKYPNKIGKVRRTRYETLDASKKLTNEYVSELIRSMYGTKSAIIDVSDYKFDSKNHKMVINPDFDINQSPFKPIDKEQEEN